MDHFQDATDKILEVMNCKPDLIIGNYTDGNLVASLMAKKLGITQVRKNRAKSSRKSVMFSSFFFFFREIPHRLGRRTKHSL